MPFYMYLLGKNNLLYGVVAAAVIIGLLTIGCAARYCWIALSEDEEEEVIENVEESSISEEVEVVEIVYERGAGSMIPR